MKWFRPRPEPEPRADVVFINRFAWPDEAATSRMLSAVAFALAKKGLKVEVISARLSYMGYDEARARMQVVDGVRFTRVPTTRFGRMHHLGRMIDYLSFYVSMIWMLSWRAPALKCVVAKTDPPLLGVPVQWVCALFGVNMVQWSQDVFPEVAQLCFRQKMLKPIWGILRKLRNAAFCHSDAVVTIGQDMYQHYHREGIPEERLYCFENFADGKAIQSVPHAGNPLREQWKLQGKFILAYSGNLGRTHEIGVFCEAAVLLAEEEDICFLFVGGGASVEKVRHRVPSYVLKRIRFEPYQPGEMLSASLSVADVHWVSLEPKFSRFIVPSKYYGVLAAGRPMVFVGDPESQLARSIEESRVGVVVEDAIAFRDAVLRLKMDLRLRQRMGQQARALLDERYELDWRIRDWERLFAQLNRG